MMALGRFRRLLDSYGADPQRWPQERRVGAQTLLNSLAQARAMLEETERVDAVIAAASAREDAALAQRSPPDAALQRLRSGVAARIATEVKPPAEQRTTWALAARIQRLLSPRLYWATMATGGGIAVAAGLLLGATYAAAPSPNAALSMLQSSPIVFLADRDDPSDR
jgi:hypothetical protein